MGILLFSILLFSLTSYSKIDFNNEVITSIKKIPVGGSFSLRKARPPQVSLKNGYLSVKHKKFSHCATATYSVFLQTIADLQKSGKIKLKPRHIKALKGIGQYDEYGWTVLEPSADSRIVYVSSSEGDDNNDGLSEATPKETIAAGDALIRDGFPDHLLLKRGDVFENVTLGRCKSGRSLSEISQIIAFSTGDNRI